MKPIVAGVFLLLMAFVVLRAFLPGLFGRRGRAGAERGASDYSNAADLIADLSNHGHGASGGGDVGDAH